MLHNSTTPKRKKLSTTVIAVMIWLFGQIINYWLVEPFIDLISNMQNTSTVVFIIGILLTVILVGFLCWKLWHWHKEDSEQKEKEERIKREDLIDTMRSILVAQMKLSKETLCSHIFDLEKNLMSDLKGILNKNDVDKSKLIDTLGYEFQNHKKYIDKHEDTIEKLLKRLERHQTDDILSKILLEKPKRI